MLKSCPISHTKVDEVTVRVQALLTAGIGILFMLQTHFFWLALLLYDFAVRAAGLPSASPLLAGSRQLRKLLPFSPHYTDAGPKQFATKIGLAMVAAALLLSLAGLPGMSAGTVGILVICAFLEGSFGFCVGCQIYPWFYHRLHPKE